MANKPYRGNPQFPNVNPERLDNGESTNDTDIYYLIDPDGQAVTLGDIQDEDGNTLSSLASQTINTPKYGRFKKIVNNGANPIYVYKWDDASGTN